MSVKSLPLRRRPQEGREANGRSTARQNQSGPCHGIGRLGFGHSQQVIEAVVFELDGVLIDSEPGWEEVRRGLVHERGGAWLLEAQKRLMGMSTPEWARYLLDELGVDLEPEKIASTVIRHAAAQYAEHLPTLRGADSTLRRVRQRWRLALASSSRRMHHRHGPGGGGVDRVVRRHRLARGGPQGQACF